MSDLITTTQDACRNACIDAYFGAQRLVHRAREERGQTAAEYTGIILLVSLIIVAIMDLGLDGLISGKLQEFINNILNSGGGGGGGGG